MYSSLENKKDNNNDDLMIMRMMNLWDTISPIPSVRITIGPLVQTLTQIVRALFCQTPVIFLARKLWDPS